MDFLSGMGSYICIVNLLKHERTNRGDEMPPAIQEEYFLEYSVGGTGNSGARRIEPFRRSATPSLP
jgi:hypothetical protein